MRIAYKPIRKSFYSENTLRVAKEILGKVLVKKQNGKILTGRIVETEAYIGDHDPACHAYRKFTKRSKTLYQKGGTIYVYFVYGFYHCFNIVTEEKGKGCAVLIRALEPLDGIKEMKKNRGNVKTIYELTNGPSKLCLAFDIDLRLNDKDITGSNFFVSRPLRNEKFAIVVSKRIGISTGEEFLYRFFIKDNPFVTKHKYNNESILLK
jgi:DNA-3-methyladenine glycosylase